MREKEKERDREQERKYAEPLCGTQSSSFWGILRKIGGREKDGKRKRRRDEKESEGEGEEKGERIC